MNPQLLTLVLFLTVAFLAAAVMMLVRDVVASRRSAIRSRLQSDEAPPTMQRLPHLDEPTSTGWTGQIDRWFYRLTYESGLSLSPEVVFLAAVGIGVVVAGGIYIWREQLFLSLAGFGVGIFLTLIYFTVLRSRRLWRIREQLPDLVDMIARAVRAGENVDQAINNVGERFPAPLGVEVRRLGRQLEMGLSMEAAMKGLSRRAAINETRVIAATLLVQRQTGGNLPLTLERLAKVIRDRITFYRQFRAATAAIKIGAVLIAFAGPLGLFFLAGVEADYLTNFLTTPFGRTLLVVAIVLQVIGIIWIFRLLNVDY